jgi:hypothetical protein
MSGISQGAKKGAGTKLEIRVGREREREERFEAR